MMQVAKPFAGNEEPEAIRSNLKADLSFTTQIRNSQRRHIPHLQLLRKAYHRRIRESTSSSRIEEGLARKAYILVVFV